ncbi:MAG: type II toxin-antitoxin system prevent-host-death family antitoxin [Chloroflexota bacterium]|nr:type II toxin-antitoxin system prevent-host-death family antitoxin [Chloroflexota bacterium]
MAQTTVGIREFKARLASYLRQVKAGNTLVITEHGKPVGRIVPMKASLQERTQAMIDAGVIAWSGRKLKKRIPTVKPRGNRTVSDLLLEDRD